MTKCACFLLKRDGTSLTFSHFIINPFFVYLFICNIVDWIAARIQEFSHDFVGVVYLLLLGNIDGMCSAVICIW